MPSFDLINLMTLIQNLPLNFDVAFYNWLKILSPTIIQEFYSNMHGLDYLVPHFVTRIQDTRIVVTLDLISEMLHVPKVEFADYPSCERLRTVFKDELSSRFCETPLSWGDR